MQGIELDMNKLINQNELTVAVGNVKVNARGDELGPGGRIIRKREDVLREASGTMPGQLSTRDPVPVPQKAPATKKSVKNVADMDPEGKE